MVIECGDVSLGFPLPESRSGARSASKNAERYFIESLRRTFIEGKEGMCLRANIMNAFERVNGGEVRRKINGAIERHDKPLASISIAKRLIHIANKEYNFQGPSGFAFFENTCASITKRKSVTWISPINDEVEADQRVAVDGTMKNSG